MPISALDESTKKLITTTKVITSIYSAVKELVENALDANANKIEINLEDNGTSLIEVKDDGCGISKSDAKYMTLPYHTSKLCQFDDLETLKTYGFRGEALNSVSRVGNVVIITKTDEEDTATSYTIDSDGRIVKSELCHRTRGTTVQVRDLFKQLFVRRQIVMEQRKSNKDIQSLEFLLKGYGICKPPLRILYKVNNNVQFLKPSLRTFKEALTNVIGNKIASTMHWISHDTVTWQMTLMIPSAGIKEFSESSYFGLQYIFINGRPVKAKSFEKIINKRIVDYFDKKIQGKSKVTFLLDLTLDPKDIDINLEPNKDIVLVKDESTIIEVINEYLNRYYIIEPSLKENVDLSNVNELPATKKLKLDTLEDIVNCDIGKQLKTPKSTKPKKSKNNIKNINSQSQESSLSSLDDSLKINEKTDLAITVPNSTDEQITQNELETLSQLPIVDLGDELQIMDLLKKHNIPDESMESPRPLTPEKKTKSNNEVFSLEAWSRGAIPNLSGGVVVKPIICNDEVEQNPTTSELLRSDSMNNKKTNGFTKFSESIKEKMLTEYPFMTAAQRAKKLIDLWKSLSSEERGYYRDLAQEEKNVEDNEENNDEIKSQTKGKKKQINIKELFKRQKSKTTENAWRRSILNWNVDLDKISNNFHNETIKSELLVIGSLNDELWLINKHSKIWIINIPSLRRRMRMLDNEKDDIDKEIVEKLVDRWFSSGEIDDSVISLIHDEKKV